MKRATQMLKMREEGATLQQIADTFGVTRQRVHSVLKNERDKEARASVRYFQQDITFCSNRKCKRKNCMRHRSNADWYVKPYHSFADFTDTQYCPKRKDGADNE